MKRPFDIPWWGMLLGVAVFWMNLGLSAAEGQEAALERLWKLALKNNPAVQSQRLQVEQARRQLKFQRRERLPKLHSSASYSYVSEIPEFRLPFTVPSFPAVNITAGTHRRYDFAATVEQPLFTGWRLTRQVQAARYSVAAREGQMRARRNALLFQVGGLYYQILLNRLQAKTLAQAIGRTELHLRRARSLLATAQATAFDTLEVANRKLQLLSQLKRLRDSGKILQAKLARLLGGKEVSVPEPGNGAGLTAAKIPPLDSLLALALRRRPELQAFRAARRAQKARAGAARSLYFPQIYGSFSYHYARPGVNFFRDEWMSYYTAGVGLKWSLWNWGQRRLQVQQAELAVRQAALQERDFENRVAEEVREAYYHLLSLRDQLELQKRLVSQERERYRLARSRYSQGLATSLDLSDAEKTLLSAELTQKQFWVQWQVVWLQLRLATGTIGSNTDLAAK